MLFNNETGRCLAMGSWYKYAAAPLLLPCNASDAAQAWLLPTGAQRLGGLLSLPAAENGTAAALTVGDSSLYGSVHGSDKVPLPDANYGLLNLTLSAYAPEPVCNNRGCDNYAPGQMWYWSPRSGRLHLGHFSANDYRCFGANCYQLTGHLPTGSVYCLAHVLKMDGNVGTDPEGASRQGADVWGGPLSGVDVPMGDYVLALVNRNLAPAELSARFSWLEVPGVGDSTTLCARELFSNTSLGLLQGGISALSVPAHDIALIRLSPDATC
jgi:hypothetical protein